MNKERKKESFKQSVFSLLISQVIVKILGLFYRLYLTNREGYGDEGNAIANGGFQVFALFLSLIAIGIPTAISKLIAEYSSKGKYRDAYKIFKVALFIFSIIGIIGSYYLYYYSNFLANNYLHIPETKLSIIALCPSVFLISVISVFKGFFSGREAIKKTAQAQALDQFTKTITTFIMIEVSVFLLKNTNTELMAACSNLATTLGNVIEFGFLYKAYLVEVKIVKKEIKNSSYKSEIRIIKIIKQIFIMAIPISLTALISTISKNIDSTTIVNDLQSLIGYEEAKRQYGILSGKIDALINLPLSFNMAIVTSLLPSIAATNGRLKLQEKRINQSFLMGLTIAVPTTLIFFVFSNEILRILFPNASDGGSILKISSFQILFLTVEQITNIILNGIGKNSIPIKAITVGVIVKGVLNKALVHRIDLPIGGAVGAAIATLACHIVTSSISLISLIKETNIRISVINFFKPCLASLMMIIISKIIYIYLNCINNFKIRFIGSFGLGILVFLIVLTVLIPIKIFKIHKKKVEKRRILLFNKVL